jgi:hypothetical protein
MRPRRRPRPRFRDRPPPGPFRPEAWRSPLRGPWLASMLSAALLPLLLVCTATGFLSHAAYEPDLGANSITGQGGIGFDLYGWRWPVSPAWLYAVTQGLHVVTGVAAIPLLLAKLWAVIPKLFEWPPIRSIAHAVERMGLALLVGAALFQLFTGVMNVQLYYPWNFAFVPVHYYGAFVFAGALAFHVALKLPVMRRALRERGVRTPLRDDLAATRPEPHREHTSAPVSPGPATISRRGLLASVGAGSLALGLMTAAQSVGGPVRRLGLLAPRGGTTGDGPNDFPVNTTAAAARVTPGMTGAGWRLAIEGERSLELSRADLLAMEPATETLPIACVEGWSTTQTWTGVRLRELAVLAGVADVETLLVESLQPQGAFNRVTLSGLQATDERSLLALRVNDADLSLDHGFPARIIVPAMPGVHNTKWVARLTFRPA